MTIVCGGDFWQIFVVVPKERRGDIVDASLNSSYLWSFFEIFELKQNMRLCRTNISESKAQNLSLFDTWLLQIDDGSFYDNLNKELIKLPSDFTLKFDENSMKSIVETVYPSLIKKYSDPVYLQERAILTSKNKIVH